MTSDVEPVPTQSWNIKAVDVKAVLKIQSRSYSPSPCLEEYTNDVRLEHTARKPILTVRHDHPTGGPPSRDANILPTMPPVQVSIQDFPTHCYVVFIDRKRQTRIGPTRRYRSSDTVMEMLRRAHPNLETVNLVERALAERRPVMIDLDLSAEQYAAIQGKPTPHGNPSGRA